MLGFAVKHQTSLNQTVSKDELSKFLASNTKSEDYVLIWGAETSYFFIHDLKIPSRYVYQYPLFTKNYQSKDMIDEFLNDIKKNRPTFIIDGNTSNDPVPPINCQRKLDYKPISDTYNNLEESSEIFEYICNSYTFKEKIANKWNIYSLKNP